MNILIRRSANIAGG